MLEQLNIPFADLLPEFRLQAEDENLFRGSDRHWNEDGHTLAASVVAAKLVEDGLVSPPP
jgi:hypothetical protein